MPHCLLLPSTARFRLWQRLSWPKWSHAVFWWENNLAAGAKNVTGSTVKVAVVEPNSLEVLGAASAFSATVMLLVLCLFGCLRERYPAIYLKKVNEPGSHGEIPPDISSSFGWMAACWRLPIDEIANFSNLDHGMLVQFCDAAVMVLVVHRITCPSDSRSSLCFCRSWKC